MSFKEFEGERKKHHIIKHENTYDQDQIDTH